MTKTLISSYHMAHDFAVCFNQWFCVKRGFTKQHLIHTNTQRPPVAFNTILASSIFHGLKKESMNLRFWKAVNFSCITPHHAHKKDMHCTKKLGTRGILQLSMYTNWTFLLHYIYLPGGFQEKYSQVYQLQQMI